MNRGLSRISSEDLHAELRRRERSVLALQRRRNRQDARLAALDARIQRAGGTLNGRAAGTGRRRAKNERSLTEVLAKVLRSTTLSVTDAAAAVKRAGYRTKSRNFRTQVNIALIKSGRFKRVGRGRYTAK
jgi:hypothetical protein